MGIIFKKRGKKGNSLYSSGQVSVEYMMIIGFATLISIPLLIIYYSHNSSSQDAVSATQSIAIAKSIVDAADTVHSLGSPSQTTLRINFPSGVELVNLSGKSVIFKVRTGSGISEIVQISKANISGAIPPHAGPHTITIKAEEGYVAVSSK